MKYIVIVLVIFMIDFALPSVGNHANAQVAHARLHKKKARAASRRQVRRKVSRKAHYRYRTLPKWRAVVAKPTGAVVIKRSGIAFHYHKGIYYKAKGSKFMVARPAVGIRVKALPPTRRKILLASNTYYYYYGTFYQTAGDGSQYEAIEAPIGALVGALPDGYEVKEIDGSEYYVLDDVYYQEVESTEIAGGTGYQVVDV